MWDSYGSIAALSTCRLMHVIGVGDERRFTWQDTSCLFLCLYPWQLFFPLLASQERASQRRNGSSEEDAVELSHCQHGG